MRETEKAEHQSRLFFYGYVPSLPFSMAVPNGFGVLV